MDRVEIEAKIRGLVANELKVPEDKLKNSDLLCDDLGGDSFDLIEICMAAEDEFDLQIDDDDFDKFKTIQDLIDFIADKRGIR